MVGIKVIAENVKTGQVKHTNTSYFTMVAKGENEKPAKVPGLILENPEDARRFLEALKRREIKEYSRQAFQNEKNRQTLEHDLGLLQNERCRLAF
jgi:acyl-CoA hydrolase